MIISFRLLSVSSPKNYRKMAKLRPYCLSIAGFDPSGGAGVIADCKTFEQLKVNGLSVITCNTVQTEDHFFSYHWIALEIVLDQINKLLDRYPVQFIKIGLMQNRSFLLAVLELLHQRIQSPTIIWDPILQPTFGGEEMEADRFSISIPDILSKVSIMTPNAPEFATLFGSQDSKVLSATVVQAIIVKGGHLKEKGKDLLYYKGKMYPFNPKINTTLEKHGTGCIFSSALTALLARESPLIKACLGAKKYVEKRIISNATLLAYHK
jgi:hydroxymethylpyrimidine/phosphomethylpyrimidine kinase